MSANAMEAVAADLLRTARLGVTPTQRLVLLSAAFFYDEEKRMATPSRKELATATGLGETSIHDALVALDKTHGLIYRTNRAPAPDGIQFYATLPDGGGIPDETPPARGIVTPPPAKRDTQHGQGFATASPPPPGMPHGRASFSERTNLDRDKGKEGSEIQSPPTYASGRAVAKAAKVIWNFSTSVAKARCKEGTNEIERELRIAVNKGGADLEAVIEGLRRYYATEDAEAFGKGPQWAIRDGEWELPDPEAQADPATPPPATPGPPVLPPEMAARAEEYDPVKWGGPPGKHWRGTVEDPGPERQVEWLRVWFGEPDPRMRPMVWDSRWGLPPGHQYSRVWPALQERFEKINPEMVGGTIP